MADEKPKSKRVAVFVDQDRRRYYEKGEERVYLDPPQTTAGQAAMQGALIDAPSNVTGIADLLVNRVDPRRRQGPPGTTPLPPSNLAGAVRSAMEGAFQREGTPTAAQTPGNQLIRSFTAGAAESLPLAGIPGAGEAAGLRGVLSRAGREAISGGFSEVGRQAAEQAGMGVGGQFATSFGAGGLARGAGSLAAGAARRFGAPAQEGAQRIVAKALSKDVKDRAEALRLLQAAQARPLFGKPNTEQILMKQFPGISRRAELALRTTTEGADLRQEFLQSSVDNVEAMAEYGNRAFQVGPVGPMFERWEDRLTAIQRKVDKAFNNTGKVDLSGKKLEGTIEGIPVDKLKLGNDQLRLDAGPEKAEWLPKSTMKIIDDYGETVDIDTLRRLRSRVTNELHTAKEQLKKGTGDRETVRYRSMMLKNVDDTIKEVAERGGAWEVQSLRRAIQTRKLEGTFFDPQDPLNRIMGGEFENVDKAFDGFLKREKHPSESLARVKRVMVGDKDAWAGVQRLMRDNLVGEEFSKLKGANGLLSETGVSKVRKDVKRLSASLEVVYGEGATKNFREFLDQAELLSKGRAVRIADSALAQGLGEGEHLVDPVHARVVAEMATFNWRRAGIRAIAMATGALPQTVNEAERVIAKAMFDPALAEGFFQPLMGKKLATWKQKVATAAIREGARSIAGAKPAPPSYYDMLETEK